MAQDLQKLKDEIWYAQGALKKQQDIRNDWASSLDIAKGALAGNPDDASTQALVQEIEDNLAQEDANLAPLRKKLEALEARLPQSNGPPERKYDPEQHPLLKKTTEKEEPEKPVVFNTGDTVEGKWGDGTWYKAKIVTILGSASAPKYKIKWLDYDDDATVSRDSLRPIQNKRKRDAAPVPAAAPTVPAPVTSTPHVISGPASVNPNAKAAKQDIPGDVGPVKKRNLPNKKQLEKGVASWKNWNSKGVGKKISQKDSMFRTGTNVNSRVGFTGSGGGMTETNKRVRYDNKAAAEADREHD